MGVSYSAAKNTKTCFVFHVKRDCKFADIFNVRLTSSSPSGFFWNQLMFKTSTLEVGVGELKLSEKEAMAHKRARMVMEKVSKALALYPKECIVSK